MILFLDFDGVLHYPGSDSFVPECLTRLADALDLYPETGIVVASSWREVHPIDKLRELLGPRLGPRVVGVNPVINEPYLKYCRYQECLRYLESNGTPDLPWVALDDERGCYPPDAPVILTNYRQGLTEDAALAFRELLRRRWDGSNPWDTQSPDA